MKRISRQHMSLLQEDIQFKDLMTMYMFFSLFKAKFIWPNKISSKCWGKLDTVFVKKSEKIMSLCKIIYIQFKGEYNICPITTYLLFGPQGNVFKQYCIAWKNTI